MPTTPKKTNNINDDLEKRLGRLESEVKEMKKNNIPNSNNNHKKFRFWVSTLFIIISAIFFVFSIADYWMKTNIINTDVWVNKTSEVIKDPNVRSDISIALANALFAKVDVNNYVSDLLPDSAKPLAGPISNSLKDLTQKEIDKVMQTELFINTWNKLNQLAHKSLIKSLQNADTNNRDNGDLLYFDGDKLLLNIQPVYASVKAGLASKGLGFVDKITPSQIDKQIQIAEIKQMPNILYAFNLINNAALYMLIPMFIFGIGGLLVAFNRRRALIVFGVSSILLLITNVQAVYLLKHPFISGVSQALQSTGDNTAQAIYNIYTKDLIYIDRLAIILMVILVVFALLTGPARISVWIRLQISKLFRLKSESPIVKWLVANTNYLITGLLIVTIILTIFPIISSVWYLVTLFIVVGIICILLLSLPHGEKRIKKELSKKEIKI